MIQYVVRDRVDRDQYTISSANNISSVFIFSDVLLEPGKSIRQ